MPNNVPTPKKVEQLTNGEQLTQKKQRGKNEQPLRRDEAIAIANEEVSKDYPSLKFYKIVACEKRFLWLIIYDGGGLECFIDKNSGEILGMRKVLHSLDEAGSNPKDGIGVNQAEAIEIAKRDVIDLFIKNESAGRKPRKIEIARRDFTETINQYNPVACELTHSWRIFFENKLKPGQNPATLPTSDTPDYVVDKKTGKIIYRQTY